MFASCSISTITPRNQVEQSPTRPSPDLFSKVLCKVKSYKISLLHTSFGWGMRFYVSLMGLKCSDTSLSRVRVPRKVLTISLAHHHPIMCSHSTALQLGAGEIVRWEPNITIMGDTRPVQWQWAIFLLLLLLLSILCRAPAHLDMEARGGQPYRKYKNSDLS